ncbi:MAG: RidA family protein, partial [Nitrospirae bacterium]
MPFELLNPEGLESPVGYAHVAKITGGKIIHVAGQAPFDANGEVVGRGDLVAQFSQVMQNLKTAVEAAGGRANDYAVLTIYI